jgi:hypothetical protein
MHKAVRERCTGTSESHCANELAKLFFLFLLRYSFPLFISLG